jgi:NAD(P)H-dependent flavin oxidoreductase YrpB (nitropropane dioxygenase family)
MIGIGSAGWPVRVRDAGIATATQVYDVSMARHAQESEDHAVLPINAGQGVGEIHDVRPAADVIRQLSAGAAALLATHAR